MTVLYPFDYLPVHPAPFPLESLTSYLLRLGNLNGFSSLREIASKCLPENRSTLERRIVDLPPTSLTQLAQLTGANEQQLWATTVQSLMNKFQHQNGGAFMRDSFVRHLRFCPACLSEELYYRLPWRFTQLNGCIVHHCHLLDACSHCTHPVPLVPKSLQLGICPTCDGNLSDCQTTDLSADEYAIAQRWQDDLVYLLTPQPWEEHPASIAASIRPWLSLVRRERGLIRLHLAQEQGFTKSTFAVIEQYQTCRSPSFHIFSAYTEALNLTWREIFGTLVERFRQTPCDTEQLWANRLIRLAEEAITSLVAEVTLVTFTAVANRVGVSPVTLRKYPAIVALVDQYSGPEYAQQVKDHRSQTLLEKTREVVLRLKKQDAPMTQSVLEAEVGMCIRNMRNYPAVKALVDQYTGVETEDLRREEREQYRLQQAQLAVETLIARNQRVTFKTVSEEMGLSPATICTERYPRLKKFVQQAARQDKMARKAAREAVLLPQVKAAIHKLESTGKLVTQRTVAAEVGLARTSLAYYPTIRQLLRSIPGQSNSARYKRENRLSGMADDLVITRDE